MDAFFTDLPMPAAEYLHWLRQSHFCVDNWQCFERALEAQERYERARHRAETQRTVQHGAPQGTTPRRDAAALTANTADASAQSDTRAETGGNTAAPAPVEALIEASCLGVERIGSSPVPTYFDTAEGRQAEPVKIASMKTSSRVDLFLAYSQQIIAQEELRVAVLACRKQCLESHLSSDAERLLAWLQARANEAEEQSGIILGYRRIA